MDEFYMPIVSISFGDLSLIRSLVDSELLICENRLSDLPPMINNKLSRQLSEMGRVYFELSNKLDGIYTTFKKEYNQKRVYENE